MEPQKVPFISIDSDSTNTWQEIYGNIYILDMQRYFVD